MVLVPAVVDIAGAVPVVAAGGIADGRAETHALGAQGERAGGGHDLLPFAGQSAALIHDIVPAGELVARLVSQTADALRYANEVADIT
jgi:nitronate monooxygenase/enoyl-[acyl-carrier protein] reductase II